MCGLPASWRISGSLPTSRSFDFRHVEHSHRCHRPHRRRRTGCHQTRTRRRQSAEPELMRRPKRHHCQYLPLMVLYQPSKFSLFFTCGKHSQERFGVPRIINDTCPQRRTIPLFVENDPLRRNRKLQLKNLAQRMLMSIRTSIGNFLLLMIRHANWCRRQWCRQHLPAGQR